MNHALPDDVRLALGPLLVEVTVHPAARGRAAYEVDRRDKADRDVMNLRLLFADLIADRLHHELDRYDGYGSWEPGHLSDALAELASNPPSFDDLVDYASGRAHTHWAVDEYENWALAHLTHVVLDILADADYPDTADALRAWWQLAQSNVEEDPIELAFAL